jgi:hypothetical protein
MDFPSVTWRKSSHSDEAGGQCVELADLTSATWRKSSHSDEEGGQCVELADLTAAVGIRDSKDPHGPHLSFSRAELAGLVGQVKAGVLDL